MSYPRFACLLAVLAVVTACSPADQVRQPASQADAGGQYREQFFETAIDNLNQLEDFNTADMLGQVESRLDEWLRSQSPNDGWTLDPMVASLPEAFRTMHSMQDLDSRQISGDQGNSIRHALWLRDGIWLRDAVWLRDAARWAAGPKSDPLQRTQNLFDWTVRNIQLRQLPAAADDSLRRRVARAPGETLLYGEGTWLDRAWVFIELARQQGLDAALLAIPLQQPARPGDQPRPWAVGVRIPREAGQPRPDDPVYLFDPDWGVPIAADVRLEATGPLKITPTTLAQAAADPKILARMSADDQHPYPVQAADVKRVVALVAASPVSLSRRMKLIEAQLSGSQRMVLTAAPAARAESWKQARQVGGAELWLYPFETVYRLEHLTRAEIESRIAQARSLDVGPGNRNAKSGTLRRARILHIKGKLTGDEGAIHFYQDVRPSDDSLEAAVTTIAQQQYQALRQRPTSQSDGQLRAQSQQLAVEVVKLALRAKLDASYWLGLVAYERADFEGALDYFSKRTLEMPLKENPWASGAKYNIGRSYEALGQRTAAVQQYRRSRDPGQLLRAAWLEAAKR